MHKPFYIFLLLILFAAGLSAQQMNFINIGNSLNLPSQECYNIMQDSRGYIWISTENGLCRYNGNSLKIYNQDNGLPEGAVYCMKENKDGSILLITSRNRVLKLENDTLKELPFTQPLLANLTDKSEIFYRLTYDKQHNLIVNSQLSSRKINAVSGAISNLLDEYPARSSQNYTIVDQPGEPYFIFQRPSESTEYSGYTLSLEFVTATAKKLITVPFKRFDIIDGRLRFCKIKGTVFLAIQNNLVKIDPDLRYTIYTLPSRILSVYKDKDDGLWIGMFQKGVNYYKDIHNIGDVKNYLRDYSVSGTLTDKEGAVWCTTLEKDVFYCNNKNLMDYSNIKALQGPCSMLKYVDHRLFISTKYDEYMVLNKDSLSYKSTGFHKNSEITDVFNYKHQLYMVSKGYLITLGKNDEPEGWVRETIHTHVSVGAYQLDTLKGKLYGASFISLLVLSNDKATKCLPDFQARARCMLPDDSTMLVGRADGLFRDDIERGTVVKIPGISSSVTKIIRTSNGEIWISTKGEGLFILKNNIAHKVSLGSELHATVYSDLLEDKNKNIWVASSNGLLKIKRAGGIISVRQFNTSNGLLANNIGKIAAGDNLLYISTNAGLCSIPLESSLTNTVAPPLYINTVKMNDSLVDLNRPLVFQYYENSLELDFDALSYKSGNGGSTLLYKFTNHDESFKLTHQNTLLFNNLEPDKYELIVYALNNDGVRSDVPVRLKFEILKPIWKTAWFIIIYILLIFLAGTFILSRIIRRTKSREAEKTRINKLISESQLSALQAQMSPHFIFNAINSIQNYILKNNEKEAYSYLAKFSKLIRMVLNNSRENTLLLETELETLNLYIQLEQLRFKNSFEFQLLVDEKTDPEAISLPAMLVQPYLENAIWHGLMNLDNERPGVLKLAFSKEHGLLKIVIEDNGIGRTRSNEYKKENLHHPVGMKLTEQRLSIIKNMEEYEKISVTITDLYNTSGMACGTRVELFLPVTVGG